MYLPLAAVIALVVLGAHVRMPKWTPAACAIAALLLGVQTSVRNRDYVSDERIWMDTIAKQPANARARNNYAVDLLRAGEMEAAAAQARAAIALDPGTAEGHKTLGVAQLSLGRSDDGIAELQRAAALDPQDGSIFRNLGEAYGARGDLASAAHAFTEAARQLPDDPFVLNRAGWLLATAPDPRVRDGARARTLAAHAVELTHHQDVESLDTLAAAHAEVGAFDAAAAVGLEAIALARATGPAAMIPELEQRLALYRAHQPVRVR
jgi:cytochrome c-type biogenesis protein CcmH/NrfG